MTDYENEIEKLLASQGFPTTNNPQAIEFIKLGINWFKRDIHLPAMKEKEDLIARMRWSSDQTLVDLGRCSKKVDKLKEEIAKLRALLEDKDEIFSIFLCELGIGTEDRAQILNYLKRNAALNPKP